MLDEAQSQLYERTDEAFHFFSQLADQILRSFAPSRILIVGPAVGLLVEALWDRGVEAQAECLDEGSVEQVRIDVRSFCSVGLGSRTARNFDVVICIDFLKWTNLTDLDANVQLLKDRAASILFLALPNNAGDGQPELPLLDWIKRLGDLGLAPRTTFDLAFASPNTLLIERDREQLTQEHAIDFVRMRKEMGSLRSTERQLQSARQALIELQARLDALNTQVSVTEAERDNIARQLSLVRGDEQLIRRRLEHVLSIIDTTGIDGATGRNSADLAGLRHQLELARRDLQMVYWSSSWRVTRPLRALGTAAPGLASGARKLAKLLYWVMTFQLGKRLKARRDFRRSAGLNS